MLAHAQASRTNGGTSAFLARKPAPPAGRTTTSTATKKPGDDFSRVPVHPKPVSELKRVGDAWHLTLQGFTEASAIGGQIWPAGLPPGVRITALAVVEEPVQMGFFEITGVTGDALNSMEPGFAKWFFDLGLRGSPPAKTLRSVRVWLNAFIPANRIDGPPFSDCFEGDDRSYSSDPKAPARMHSEVVFENLHTSTPTMAETHWCGETREVDCDTGARINAATAPTSSMKFYNFRYPGAVVFDWSSPYPPPARPPEITVGKSEPVSVDYIGAGTNPLVSVAPAIDMWASIKFNVQSGVLSVSGKADGFPAFEGWATVNEKHGPFNLFALDGNGSISDLFWDANRPFNKALSLGSYVATGK